MKRPQDETERTSPDSPAVSVVVPSYRSRETIEATLRSVLDQTLDRRLEILVIDSSEDDADAELIEERFPQVRLVRAKERLLPGAARNRGCRESRGEILAFLDADAVAARDWLERLIGRLESGPEPPVMAAAAIADGGPATAAAQTQFWIEFSEFHPGHPRSLRPNLPSCNFVIRRNAFLKAGGFDSSLAMSEDWDLSNRIEGRILFESSTQVRHRQRSTWPEVLPHLERLGYWSGVFRVRRTVPGSGLQHLPSLSLFLVPFRLARILGRMRRSGALSLSRRIALIPSITRGLIAWRKGFSRGLRVDKQRRPDGADKSDERDSG